jgi:hypothetical protein
LALLIVEVTASPIPVDSASGITFRNWKIVVPTLFCPESGLKTENRKTVEIINDCFIY